MADIKLLTEQQGFNIAGQMSNLALPPNNEIIYDDAGLPSVMVKIPIIYYCDVGIGDGLGEYEQCTPLPAFTIKVDNKYKEIGYIYISKYQNIVKDGKAYSLPYQQPTIGLSYDEAKAACAAKGKGWHLMTNAEWAAVALWCRQNNCLPLGNTSWMGAPLAANFNAGYNRAFKDDEMNCGAPAPTYYTDSNGIFGDVCWRTTTLTGSGPNKWFHNYNQSGITDLCGNVWEWVSGIRVKDTHNIQIIPRNDAALNVDESDTSTAWREIERIVEDCGGYYSDTLVEPGADNTYQFITTLNKTSTAAGTKFKEITNVANDYAIPPIIPGLALAPTVSLASKYPTDCVFLGGAADQAAGGNLYQRIVRGGDYTSDYGNTGIFSYAVVQPDGTPDLNNCPVYTDLQPFPNFFGFRAAYIDLDNSLF